MKKFVTSALAIAALGAVSNAATGDNDWLGLDNEISTLASSFTTPEGDLHYTALLRITYTYSTDDVATGGGDDISGFSFEDVDIAIWGSIGDYGWRLSTDVTDKSGGNIALEDGYAWFNCGEYFQTFFGSYKPKTLRSSSVYPENQLFINRTLLGSAFDVYNLSLGAHGMWEQVHWNLDVLNGENDQERDHIWVLRGDYALGSGSGMTEGARGSTDALNGEVGVFWIKDDTRSFTDSDNTIYGIDFNGNISHFGFGVEITTISEDYFLMPNEDFSRLGSGVSFELGNSDDDATLFSLTGSFLVNEQWEVGVRFEQTDNDDDVDALTLGANYYVCTGVTWQLNVADFNSDDNSDEGTVWQGGLAIGSSK